MSSGPYFDNAPGRTATGPPWRTLTDQTPLTVGSPAGRSIEKTLRVPGLRRRLPAPAVPARPRGPAAQDRPGEQLDPARRGGSCRSCAQEFAANRPADAAGGADPSVAARSRFGEGDRRMKLVVVSAGLTFRRPRAAGRPAGSGGGPPDPVDIQVVELRDLAVEIAHNFTTTASRVPSPPPRWTRWRRRTG
ncbi:hypothetical protein ACRAWF_38670 [Streptomyces sp. L7]